MIEKYQQDELQIFNASAQAYFLFKSKCKVNYNSLLAYLMLYSLVLKESRILSFRTCHYFYQMTFFWISLFTRLSLGSTHQSGVDMVNVCTENNQFHVDLYRHDPLKDQLFDQSTIMAPLSLSVQSLPSFKHL